MTLVDPGRVQSLTDGAAGDGPVLYWMSRDMRVADNWALHQAHERAAERGVALAVCFTLVEGYLDAPWRAYAFMLDGLEIVAGELARRGIPFHLLRAAEPGVAVAHLALELEAGLVVCDFNPLRTNLAWQEALVSSGVCPVERVDAHNIVPYQQASNKQEFAARTIRPKIHRLLPRFLVEPPPAPQGSPRPWDAPAPTIDWPALRSQLRCDRSVPALDWLTPGEPAALDRLAGFIDSGLRGYDKGRNDPNLDAQSELSPYLHFGHVAAQRVAMAVRDSGAPEEDVAAYLEELIVRKELSDNFCFYSEHYDRFSGFHAWAQKTLNEHREDPRDPCYDRETLDRAQTHDPLWNAAQVQLRAHGKMHGYLRMYWAKKILQWTASPEDALAIGIALNDRYSIDGRDPNGYVGVAWSVGGVHDRAWGERPIFGKIRYMSYAGCRRKFKVDAFIERWLGEQPS